MKQETSDAEPPAKPRRWWRWFKRAFWTGVILLAVLIGFHPPLLRLALHKGGPWLAQKADFALAWTVEGSILGDLKLTEFELGAESAPWLSVQAGEIAADYSLWTLLREGPADFLSTVRLHDVEVNLDLTQKPPSKPKPEKPKDDAPSDPALVWPRTLDLKNVTLNLHLDEGKTIQLHDFTLQAGEGQPGVISWAGYSGPSENLALEAAQGGFEWGDRQVRISDLPLPFGLQLDSLAADLSELLGEGRLKSALAVALGEADLSLEATLDGLKAEQAMEIDALLKVENLQSSDLVPLKMPETLQFGPSRLGARVVGDPAQPRALTLDLDLALNGFATAGVKLDATTLRTTIAEGGETKAKLAIEHETNEITLDVEATLAETWAAWQEIAWQARLDLDTPDPMAVMEDPLPLEGALRLEAEAEGRGAVPSSTRAQLGARPLKWETWTVPELESRIEIDGDVATVEIPTLGLGEGNTITLQTRLTMDEALPLEAQWNLAVKDPKELWTTLGQELPEGLPAGVLATEGKAALDLKPVLDGDYTQATATLDLSVEDLQFEKGGVEGLQLAIDVKEGKAQITSWHLQVDEHNHGEGTAELTLATPWAYQVQANFGFPELPHLSPLLESFKGPAITSGALEGALAIQGELTPWNALGNLDLSLSQFESPILPETVALDVAADFEGTDAALETLHVEFGEWILDASGHANTERALLETLTLHQGETPLAEGRVLFPYDFMSESGGGAAEVELVATELEVAAVAAAAGVDGLPGGKLSLDLDLGGRLDTLAGQLQLDWQALQVEGLALEPANIDLDLDLEPEALTLDGEILQPPLQPLTLDAAVKTPIGALIRVPSQATRIPLEVGLSLPTSDLSSLTQLQPELLRTLPLTASLEAKATGTVEDFDLDANLMADAPEIEFVDSSLPSVRDVKVRIRSTRSEVAIEEISALLAGGQLRLDGRVDVSDLTEPSFDVTAKADEALLYRNPDISLRADANLNLAGTPKVAALAGKVELVRGRVYQEIDLLPLGFEPKLPPKPISTERAQTELVLPEALADWTFDVDLRTRDPIRISGNLLVGSVAVDAHAGGTGAAPLLTGGATIEKAAVQLPFSRLDLQRGTIRLNPEQPFNPSLSLRGLSEMGTHDVTVYVYGSVQNLKTQFTSVPPLPESDIATLLATGTTLDGESGEAAASRAMFLAASQMVRKVLKREKKVTDSPPRLRVTLSPSVANAQMDSVQATYELTDRFELTGRFRESGQMKLILGYLMRFGEAVRAMDVEALEGEEREEETP